MNKTNLLVFLVNILILFSQQQQQLYFFQSESPKTFGSQGSEAVSKFTQNLHPLVCQDGENCAISAYSVFNALGLVYAGAKGRTRTQIQNVLNLKGLKIRKVHQIFKNTTDSVFSVSPEIQLFQANRFYGENTIEFFPKYLNTLQNYHYSDAKNLDFKNNPDGSRREINAWVEGITKNLIQNLLPPGSITQDTVTVLTNTLYFKGMWRRPFNPRDTYPGIFNTSTGIEIEVPMMMQQQKRYYVGDIPNIQSSFIQLPYEGSDISMYIIVPKTTDGISSDQKIESVIQNLNFEDVFNKGEYSSVTVLAIPKFSVKFELKMSDPLKKLGMVDAWDEWGANFGGMTDLEEISPQNIYVSEGFHKVKIVVDESGTEAAAATAFNFPQTTSLYPTVKFMVDQPFGFYIVKEPENVILFNGIINNPISE